MGLGRVRTVQDSNGILVSVFRPGSRHRDGWQRDSLENPTGTHHTITHDGCLGPGACAFDSGSIGPDGTFEISGLPPGLYSYHCTLHPIMRGTVVIVAAGSSSEI